MSDQVGVNVFLILRGIYDGGGDLGWSVLVGERNQAVENAYGSSWEVISDHGDLSSHKGFMTWYEKWGRGQGVLEWVTSHSEPGLEMIQIRVFWVMGGFLKSLSWSFEDIKDECGWRFRWMPVEFVNLCKNLVDSEDVRKVVNCALDGIKNKVTELIKSDFLVNFAIKDGIIIRKGYGELVKKELES